MTALNLLVKQPPATTEVQEYHINPGAQVDLLPIEVFPDFWSNVYLILFQGRKVLIDCGLGFGESDQTLLKWLEEISGRRKEKNALSTIDFVFITHGHIDHYGGLSFIRRNSQAQGGVHELDSGMITHQGARMKLIFKRLQSFLHESGVPNDFMTELAQLYPMTRLEYSPVYVGFTFEIQGMKIGPFELLHVPGHSSGHVVLRLHDFIFSGDHILLEISPHRFPDRLFRNAGLENYLTSLTCFSKWSTGTMQLLPGHGLPIMDPQGRITEIKILHQHRLEEILSLFDRSQSTFELSTLLFPDAIGYDPIRTKVSW